MQKESIVSEIREKMNGTILKSGSFANLFQPVPYAFTFEKEIPSQKNIHSWQIGNIIEAMEILDSIGLNKYRVEENKSISETVPIYLCLHLYISLPAERIS